MPAATKTSDLKERAEPVSVPRCKREFIGSVLIIRRESPSCDVAGRTARIATQFLLACGPSSLRESRVRRTLKTVWTDKGQVPDFPLVQKFEYTTETQLVKALYSHGSS